MKKLWMVLRGFLTFIGLGVVLLAFAGGWAFREQPIELPEKIVLAATLYGTPVDGPAAPEWLGNFVPVIPTLAEVTGGIYAGAQDPRVSALAVKLASGHYGWAEVQELREAVAVFRAAGKKTYIYADTYGDLYPGMAEYYLASAFDEIWLQPVGSVAITGFSAEVPYFRPVLEKIGVNPEILQKGDYKTAPESALLESMSPAQRETLHGILSSMMTDFFEGVSQGRGLQGVRVGQMVDGAPYTAVEAKERNLVDVVGYLDELSAKLIPFDSEADEGFVDTADYLAHMRGNNFAHLMKKGKEQGDNKDKNEATANGVALVYVSGLIVPDDGGQAPGPWGDGMAYADAIAGAIQDASSDESVGAIVLRVASPGGSPSASETIRRAVAVAKDRGKYVVVSMGGEAASGGYWIVVDADRIFAQPGTLTGSIGVFGGKVALGGMWDKIGVNWDSVQMGANAGIWSPNRPYDDAQRAAIQRMLDDVYDAFIDRVATGRDFAPDVVETMAQGRVWTGRQAKERGLVDDIGGLQVALADAAAHMGVAVTDLDIQVLPETPGPFADIMGFLAGRGGVLGGVLGPLKPVFSLFSTLNHPEYQTLRAENFGLIH